MKTLEKLSDEIPVTKIALEIYITELEKVFKPIRLQFHRMDDLLVEAKNRLKRMK